MKKDKRLLLDENVITGSIVPPGSALADAASQSLFNRVELNVSSVASIVQQLRNFRRKQNKPKVDLAEFMKYLADHYNCDSPYELGVRIHSVGLPLKVSSASLGL